MKELSPDFFERDVIVVAKDLLGKIIQINGCSTRIVETEAYGRDAASHAFTKTPRSAIMYDTYGQVYVYLIYGMYYCLNFTTNPIGEAGAVLIRAAEPLTGIAKIKKRRKTEKITALCNGPGKLCSALNIDTKLNDTKIGSEIKVFDDGFQISKIGKSSRIGIKDAQHLPWRFYIEGNEFVSKNKK